MSYLKELNQLVVYMEKFSARLDAENSVNRHMVAVSLDNIKKLQSQYYEVLKYDSLDDEPYQPLKEVK
jgi:hypothetical protein